MSQQRNKVVTIIEMPAAQVALHLGTAVGVLTVAKELLPRKDLHPEYASGLQKAINGLSEIWAACEESRNDP